jgi:hypothetical protein
MHGTGGGAPQVVYDARGVPLIVEIGASVDDLGEAVGGRHGKYRLDCVDEYGRKLTSLAVPAAYVVIGEVAGAAADGGGAGDVSPALAIVAQLAKANGDAMTSIVQQISAQIAPLVQAATKLVEAVDSAGVSRRPAPPVVEAEIVDIATLQKATAAEPSAWRPVVEAVLPHVPVLLQAAMALLGSRAAPVISPPPPVVPT